MLPAKPIASSDSTFEQDIDTNSSISNLSNRSSSIPDTNPYPYSNPEQPDPERTPTATPSRRRRPNELSLQDNVTRDSMVDDLLMSFNNMPDGQSYLDNMYNKIVPKHSTAPSLRVIPEQSSTPPTPQLQKKRSFFRRWFGRPSSPERLTATTPTPRLWIRPESESEGSDLSETQTASSPVVSPFAESIHGTPLDPLETVEELGDAAAGQQRRAYMETFDFTNHNILAALRMLCSRLPMKGETQQLDRVLDAFSERWVECNPRHGFKQSAVVHTICYSLFLLNTDIYLLESFKKMTKQQYLRNTLDTIRANLDETSDTSFDSTRTSQDIRTSQDTLERRTSEDQQSLRPTRPLSAAFPSPMFSETNCFENMTLVDSPFDGTTKAWESQIENVLKDFYNSIRRTRLPVHHDVQPLVQTPTTTSASASTRNVFRRSNSMLSRAPSFSASTILTAATSYPSTPSTPTTPTATKASVGFAQALGNNESLALAGAPWAKEGIVSTKTKRGKGKTQQLFAVVEKEHLRLFDFTKKARHTPRTTVVGGGNWLDSALELPSLPLRHAFATVKQGFFRVELPDSGSLPRDFFVTSPEIAQEFADTINYWAARASKPPMQGSVGNIEYGFSPTPPGTKIFDWIAPVPPATKSNLEETEQLAALREHLKELLVELEEHRKLRPVPSVRGMGGKGGVNWVRKEAWLVGEERRWRAYVLVVERAAVRSAGMRKE